MVDLRNKVEADRGLLKQIELIIPGFRGYRLREDLRIADSLLREGLVREMKISANNFEEIRKALAKRNEIDVLEDAGILVSKTNALIAKIQHAEQGYTGISADHRIDIPELNQMYEWDLSLLHTIDRLNNASGSLKATVRTMDSKEMAAKIARCLQDLDEFELIYENRRAGFAGLDIREGP